MLLHERHDRAEESGQVVYLLNTPDKIKESETGTTTTTKTAVVVDKEVIVPAVDVSLFEEIRSAIGFSLLNNTNDLIPHDEDLIGWHSPEAPRPNRRLMYDPIKIID